MIPYLLAFVMAFWPHLTRYQQHEARAIVAEVAATDGTVLEDLELVNIAAMESYFDRSAVGRLGERGAWQVMPPAREYGAREALRRLRAQGIAGYCGCRGPCPAIVAHRVDRAYLWRMSFDPRPEAPGSSAVAVLP